MHFNFIDFKKHLETFFLFEKNPKIAVGVSGGPDSLLLVFLLNKWIKEKKGKLISLIVDHGIRIESRSECIKTQKFLNKHKIKNHILIVPKNKVKEGKLNQSRENRFEKLINYCKKNDIFHLFLGHHFDDNLETFILRKIAGSNFEGLNSMNYVSYMNQIQIIRPLLNVNKRKIIYLNNKFNLPYIKDPSNYNIKYSRIAVRKYLKLDSAKVKLIKEDFSLVRRNYNLYIKMIYQIIHSIIIEIKLNKLILNAKIFLRLNYEIQVKILLIFIKYVNNQSINLRTKKIDGLIDKIKNHKNITIESKKTSILLLKNKIIITRN